MHRPRCIRAFLCAGAGSNGVAFAPERTCEPGSVSRGPGSRDAVFEALRGLGNLWDSLWHYGLVVGSVLSVVLLMAPAQGLVPSPPGSGPAVETPVPTVSETAPPPVEANPTPASGTPVPVVDSKAPTTPELVRARAAQPAKDAPPAPEPDASSRSSSMLDPFEMSGFMDRPTPSAPVVAVSDEDAGPANPSSGKLVWGIHRPVARWKRNGLIGSGVLTGVAIAGAVTTRIAGQRRLDEVSRYLEERGESAGFRTSVDPITACRLNRGSAAGGAVVVDDVGLAHRCQRFDRMRVTRGVSVGLSVVGILSTATFAVLHLVHRQEEPRRLEARSDGFAVRF